jgi:hypothetical protein
VGLLVKFFRKLETLVANSSNKIDDAALAVVKDAMREALKEESPK